jgi:hypothetical protein
VCLHAFNVALAKDVLKVPDTRIPMWMMLVGYPAESPEAGGSGPAVRWRSTSSASALMAGSDMPQPPGEGGGNSSISE